MEKDKKRIFLNTVLWGFLLWLFGYILGMIFFAFVPKNQIGWYISPLGIIATLWVLIKKIKRESFTCYIGLGVIWTLIAIVLDYLFLVKLFHSADYYKIDVYCYYLTTFTLPLVVGWYKYHKKIII